MILFLWDLHSLSLFHPIDKSHKKYNGKQSYLRQRATSPGAASLQTAGGKHAEDTPAQLHRNDPPHRRQWNNINSNRNPHQQQLGRHISSYILYGQLNVHQKDVALRVLPQFTRKQEQPFNHQSTCGRLQIFKGVSVNSLQIVQAQA